MLFNSYIFLLAFLPLTWILFRLLSRYRVTRVAIALLVVASLVFYSYWNPPFVLLILFSIGFNFTWGRVIEKKGGERRWPVIAGVAVNLALIGYFKYTGFFIDNLSSLLGTEWKTPQIFLPLGISFFTFQQIAYLVDCHRGLTRELDFLHYCLFVTFFPQLIAGPIVHHREMMPQFASPETFVFNPKNVSFGLSLLVLGLFKKVIIADTLSPWVGAMFDGSVDPTLFAAWIGALAYTFQIYFDFSGYSEMALGLGYLFNIELPINFNSPYKSTSIVDFWRRWHMTLSRFLRDYLYFPLGGNRKGKTRRYINLLLTMLLGGLWHGAAWTFVIWGGLHGVYLCINHAWKHLAQKTGFDLPRPIHWFFTFVAVVFAWVFFRATSLERAVVILRGMVGSHGVEKLDVNLWGGQGNSLFTWLPINEQLTVLGLLSVICLTLPTTWHWTRNKLGRHPILHAVVIGLLFVISVLGMTRISEFLYFQF